MGLTVKELIKQLGRLPPDALVVIANDEGLSEAEATSATLMPPENVVIIKSWREE